MLTKSPPIVVLGLDKEGHPRAATFSGNDMVPASKAAGILGLQIGRAESPEAIALVKKLPLGRVFATGKGLMPRAKRELYETLLKILRLEDPKPAAMVAAEAAPEKAALKPHGAGSTGDKADASQLAPYAPWSWIEVGGTVLWCADPKEGYFPCTVTGASKDGKMLTLKWRDFAGFKPFQVKRLAVGLLCITP